MENGNTIDAARLAEAVIGYQYAIDMEWAFAGEHGICGEYWDEGQTREHDRIVSDVLERRRSIGEMIGAIRGDPGFRL